MRKYLESIYRAFADKEWKVYAILGLLASVLYFRWLNFGVFSYGDWSYKYATNLKDLTGGAAWITNTDWGAFNELLWRAPLDFMFGLLAALGMGINVSEKLLVFWPIALTSFMAPYFLLRQLSFRKLHAFLGAVFYATNTYFLSINPQGHGLLILAGNLLTLSYGFYIKAVHENKMWQYILSALILWLVSVADFRLFYMGMLLFGGYSLYQWVILRQRLSWYLVPFLGVTLLLQLCWLASTAMSFRGGSDTILSRSLFGGEYWSLLSALSLHYPFWTGKTTSWFVMNDIPVYFWLIPALAIISLYIHRLSPKYSYFGILGIVGVLLSKQTGAPFGWIYPFLYQHVPGFSAFRESTKFYYFVLISYTVLITALLAFLVTKKHKVLYIGSVVFVVFISVLNSLPYLTGSMGKLVSKAELPGDYQTIANKLDSDKDYYRTLWVPIAPRWSYYSTNHPRINSSSLSKLPISSKADNTSMKTAQQINDLITAPMFQDYLSSLSVKYVMVPLRDVRNNDNFFKFYGEDRQFYIDTLDSSPFLKRVDMGTKDVAVYENTQYKPYISSLSSVYTVDSLNDLDPADNFIKSATSGAFSFAALDKQQKSVQSGRTLDEAFADMEPSNVSPTGVSQDVIFGGPTELYAAPKRQYVSYSTTNNKTTFKATAVDENLSIDGKEIYKVPPSETVLGTIELQGNRHYFVAHDDRIDPLKTAGWNRMVGKYTKPAAVYIENDKNLLPNGSFEQGTWQSKVQDCDKYEDKSPISQTIGRDDTYQGFAALQLIAASHIACTQSPVVGIVPNHQYLLSFAYKAPYAERISFRIEYDKGGSHTYSLETGGSGQWQTVRQLIATPAGASTIKVELRGLPLPNFSNAKVAATTNYDEVGLNELLELGKYVPPTESTAAHQKIATIESGKHTISHAEKLDAKNLVPNGDFESGTWQKNAEDCAAGTDTDAPQLQMKIDSGASSGKNALFLSAARHVACTHSSTIPVREGQSYLFSFSHRSPNTKTASYSISFNDDNKTTLSEYVVTGGDWKSYQKVFTAPDGATLMTIKVYARSYSDMGESTVNVYDDFKLLAVPDLNDKFYLVQQPAAPLGEPKSVAFTQTRTSKDVAIKEASRPFYLTMGEAYNNGWKVQASGMNIADNAHIKLNAFENAWYIDPAAVCAAHPSACRKRVDGSNDMNLAVAFYPQQVYRWATFISYTSLAGCVVYLMVHAILARKSSQSDYRRKR